MTDYLRFEIVIVEDDPNDLELTQRALKRQNLANPIRTFNDGAEVVEFFFGPQADERVWHDPKLILLDLKLPKVSGLEVLRQLKQDKRTKHIPVVVLSSSREDQDIALAYDLGANSYIVKPVEFDGFMAAVAQVGGYWMLLNQCRENFARETTKETKNS
jgi:two-component system response regulator